MKAITIKQPYALLICEGLRMLNRTWRTNFRGRILIHAAAKPAKIDFEVAGQATAKEIQMFTALGHAEEDALFGCIIGSVEIVDCVINHQSIWAEKTTLDRDIFRPVIFNWVLANPVKFPEPIPAKGKLSLWDYPNILAEQEEKDGELFCHCQLPVKEINQVTGDSTFGYYCLYCGGRWYK